MINVYKTLIDKVDEGKKVVLVTKIKKTCENKILLTEDNLSDIYATNILSDEVYEKVRYAFETGNIQLFNHSEKEGYLIEPYFPEPRLVVFGGGHIAKPLVQFGSKVGFKATVIDDRPSFANKERFPDAEKVICESFEKCFKVINLNKASFAVIVTRGHRHDIECLREVLKYDTAYIGMIGSKRRIKAVMEQLLSEGYSKESLDRVNAPIGMDINAITPEEIAISIIAQLIKYRRANKALNVNWPEFDKAVLTELSNEEKYRRAIITIVSTKGSVPRKAGAKMLVWQEGKILGSIGGGCSEGEVINKAYEVIRNGGYQIQQVDMTGEIAEDEGMACGGIMEVLIETSDYYQNDNFSQKYN